MIVKNGLIFTPEGFTQASLRTENGRIAEIGQNLPENPNETVLNAGGAYVLPGLIDLHTHGCAGEDFSYAGSAGIAKMRAYYAAHGITGVAATTVSLPRADLLSALTRLNAAAKEKEEGGARLLALRCEGPFFGPEKKGAQNPAALVPPSSPFFEEMMAAAGGLLKILDADPAQPGALPFVSAAAARVRISLGHSNASYEKGMQAFQAGASMATHLFNAMSGLHHREPGLAGAALDAAAYCELIADGIHLHPAILRLVFRLCPEKAVLISDSMAACGLPGGAYRLGGLPVAVAAGRAELADENGNPTGVLAGAAKNLYADMVNAISVGVPAEQAITAATRTPAKLLGCPLSGALSPGCYADFLLAAPDWALQAVYISGRRVSA